MERRIHARALQPRPYGAWLLRTLRRHGRPSRLRLFWWTLVGLTVAAALAFQASAVAVR